MNVTVFGYQIRLRRYIKHSSQRLITFPNTSTFLKNTSLRVVFFNSLLSVLKYGQTQSFVFDVLHSTRRNTKDNMEGSLPSITLRDLFTIFPRSFDFQRATRICS